MLEFLQRYHVGVYDDDLGRPIDDDFPLTDTESHNGSQDGVNTLMVQRTDGVNVFVAFNERGDPHYASDFYNDVLEPLLDAGPAWPATTSDGFWVNTNGVLPFGGTGGYHDDFDSFPAALAYVEDGSKLRLKPGSAAWVGVLQTRLLLDAPLGHAVLGD
jgi:hypothetical protein